MTGKSYQQIAEAQHAQLSGNCAAASCDQEGTSCQLVAEALMSTVTNGNRLSTNRRREQAENCAPTSF